ncbi:MAG: hypothetical protein LBQ02_03130 [Candidatus Nomurabacteria bacterium]|jgi:hypothetical protein|nr:hypothetical protein [Candidatus Nomurabacteria bacterium]
MEEFSVQNKINLTGGKAIVQTDTGLYYGTLEKADTRYGTALLADAWMVPLEYVLDEYVAAQLIENGNLEDDGYFVKVHPSLFDSYPKGNITSLASEGIVVAIVDEVSPACGKAKVLSLTGVTAIVPITERHIIESFNKPYVSSISNTGIEITSDELEELWSKNPIRKPVPSTPNQSSAHKTFHSEEESRNRRKKKYGDDSVYYWRNRSNPQASRLFLGRNLLSFLKEKTILTVSELQDEYVVRIIIEKTPEGEPLRNTINSRENYFTTLSGENILIPEGEFSVEAKVKVKKSRLIADFPMV